VVHYKLAESAIDRERVFDSRFEIAHALFPFLFASTGLGHPAKDEFEDHSQLFFAESEGRVVASCRTTPCVDGKWEISSSLPDGFTLPVDPKSSLQLNRVYVDKRFRRHFLHEKLFYHLSEWLLAHTEYKHYFATCNAGLLRLYHRLGAVVLTPNGLALKGRLSQAYYVVHGEIAEFNTIAKQIHSL
jgi:GNAT superfamily N-acetyltransferase